MGMNKIDFLWLYFVLSHTAFIALAMLPPGGDYNTPPKAVKVTCNTRAATIPEQRTLTIGISCKRKKHDQGIPSTVCCQDVT